MKADGRDPSLSQGRPPEPEPSGGEPGLRAEYAILEVLLTLGDLDPQEREAAIELLLELGRGAIPALVRASTEDRRDARLAAAHAMGILGYDEFLPELHRLAHDPDPLTQATAAEAYTRITLAHRAPDAVLHLFTGALPPPACDAVFALLHEHGYPFERLPDRPTVNLIPLLVRYMRATHLPWEGLSVDDPDPVPLPLRETPVYRALLSLGPAAVEALLREAHVRGSLASTAALGALLGDLAADPAVRRRIAEALLAGPGFDYMHIITRSVLQQHGDLALLRHMLDALYPRFDPAAYHLAAALVYLLADMGTPDDLPRLRQWTQAGSPPLADLARRIHDRLAGGGVQFA